MSIYKKDASNIDQESLATVNESLKAEPSKTRTLAAQRHFSNSLSAPITEVFLLKQRVIKCNKINIFIQI